MEKPMHIQMTSRLQADLPDSSKLQRKASSLTDGMFCRELASEAMKATAMQ